MLHGFYGSKEGQTFGVRLVFNEGFNEDEWLRGEQIKASNNSSNLKEWFCRDYKEDTKHSGLEPSSGFMGPGAITTSVSTMKSLKSSGRADVEAKECHADFNEEGMAFMINTCLYDKFKSSDSQERAEEGFYP